MQYLRVFLQQRADVRDPFFPFRLYVVENGRLSMRRKRGRICCVQSRRTTTMENGVDTARGHAPWHLFLTIALVIMVES